MGDSDCHIFFSPVGWCAWWLMVELGGGVAVEILHCTQDDIRFLRAIYFNNGKSEKNQIAIEVYGSGTWGDRKSVV